MDVLSDERCEEDDGSERRRSKRIADSLPDSSSPKKAKKADDADSTKGRVVDDAFMKRVKQVLKHSRPRSLTREEKFDIIAVQAHIRHEHFQQQSKASKKGKAKCAQATERAAKYLGRSRKTCTQVWSDFVKGEGVAVQKNTGNFNTKACIIPDLKWVTNSIHEFIRGRRETRARAVARDVMDHCVAKNIIAYDINDTKQYMSALRAVQRFLHRKGYKHVNKKGQMCYKLREDIIKSRDAYVWRMISLNTQKNRRIVYMGESYIHHNYHRNNYSLYDPNDEQDLQVKAPHKGNRYCFIAAILDADYNVPEASRNKFQVPHFMEDTLDIFAGGKKQTKNYLGMFGHKYFRSWMEKLFAALNRRGIHNAVIVMDNSKHHRSLPESTPKSTWRKDKLLESAAQAGLDVGSDSTLPKSIVWDHLKLYIRQNIKPVICNMATERGHEVIFSPPHHSDLQPIELIWAHVKGTVGQQYTTQTSFTDVLERLNAAFENLESETVQGCIKKANFHLDKLYQHIIAFDSDEESSDEESQQSISSNGGDNDEFTDFDVSTIDM